MPRKATPKPVAKVIIEDTPKPVGSPPVTGLVTAKPYAGPTSGVMAPGAVGKAAREAARKAWNGGA